MEHRFVNVAQRKVADPFTYQRKVFPRKPAAFPDEVIRPGVQKQYLRRPRFQVLDDLPYLMRRGRAQISRPDKTNAVQIEPGATAARAGPALKHRAVGPKPGGEQDEQFVVGEVIQPGRCVGVEEGLVVVSGNGDDRNAPALRRARIS